MKETEFLIVGAGPFSLSTAAYAKSLGIDVTIVGKTLHFWNENMPAGMFLRSSYDWHLDPQAIYTFESYVKSAGIDRIEPVPLQLFRDYVHWFIQENELEITNQHVTNLVFREGKYLALLEDGSEIRVKQVLLALGFALFRNVPEELSAKLPEGSFTHTCDTVDFRSFRDKRVLMIGGRQSAFEWAALIRESGAEEIHLVFRHPSPSFSRPDWTWVLPMAMLAIDDHSWWRNLSADEQEGIRYRFFANGRLILEPWLDDRVHQPNIQIHERSKIANGKFAGETYDVELESGEKLNVHHTILATGYRTEMENVYFLDHPSILERLEIAEGSPRLDPDFQTNLPGLFVSGLAATRDFGPFFGFTVGCPVAAKIIAEKVSQQN